MKKFIQSVWFFPAVLLVLVVGLATFQVHGSSIGQYHIILNGQNQKDPNLLFGVPQPIRSDEWLFVTQMAIAQEKSGYPHVNQNLGEGKDMSLILDVPYKEWSVIFKPQTLAFFVVPFENAFAFKWWFLLYLLIVATYFFTLRIYGANRLFAVLIGLAFGFSPFVMWWYQASTLGTLVYGFIMLILLMRLANGERIPFLTKYHPAYSYTATALALSYVLVCFALLMYPPFQIPVAISAAMFFMGYLANQLSRKEVAFKTMLKRLGVIVGAAIVAGSIVLTFLNTRAEAVHQVTNTVYPGNRVVEGGDLHPLYMFSSFLSPLLQSHTRNFAGAFINNQSEVSNFIMLLPFLLLPGLLLIGYEFYKHHRFDWLFVSVHAVGLLFIARMFTSFGDWFFQLLFLHKVPNTRLIIGAGFIGIIQFILLHKKLRELRLKLHILHYLLIAAYTLACLLALLWVGTYVIEHYPSFLSSEWLLLALSLGFLSILVATLCKQPLIAASLLLAFTLVSVYRVHPLYRGLDIVRDSKLTQAIESNSRPGDTWVDLDAIVFENIGPLSNRDTLGGVHAYPDKHVWKEIAPNDEGIYNRYAHVVFTASPDQKEPIKLAQLDAFTVKFGCTDFIRKHIEFVVSEAPLNDVCIKQLQTVTYPLKTFYLYRVD